MILQANVAARCGPYHSCLPVLGHLPVPKRLGRVVVLILVGCRRRHSAAGPVDQLEQYACAALHSRIPYPPVRAPPLSRPHHPMTAASQQTVKLRRHKTYFRPGRVHKLGLTIVRDSAECACQVLCRCRVAVACGPAPEKFFDILLASCPLAVLRVKGAQNPNRGDCAGKSLHEGVK